MLFAFLVCKTALTKADTGIKLSRNSRGQSYWEPGTWSGYSRPISGSQSYTEGWRFRLKLHRTVLVSRNSGNDLIVDFCSAGAKNAEKRSAINMIAATSNKQTKGNCDMEKQRSGEPVVLGESCALAPPEVEFNESTEEPDNLASVDEHDTSYNTLSASTDSLSYDSATLTLTTGGEGEMTIGADSFIARVLDRHQKDKSKVRKGRCIGGGAFGSVFEVRAYFLSIQRYPWCFLYRSIPSLSIIHLPY